MKLAAQVRMTCMRHRKPDQEYPARHAMHRRKPNARGHHQIIVTIVAAVSISIVQVAVRTILTEVLANIKGLHNIVMVELRVTITTTDEKVMETDGKHALVVQVKVGSTIVTSWEMT